MRITWRGKLRGQSASQQGGAFLWPTSSTHVGHPFIRVTQLPVETAIQGPTQIWVTQLPVETAIQGTSRIFVTQVPILYLRQFLNTCLAPPPTDTVVKVAIGSLTPRWKLERYDIKPRMEERMAGNPIGPSVDHPSWAEDGLRWRLERFDLAQKTEERA